MIRALVLILLVGAAAPADAQVRDWRYWAEQRDRRFQDMQELVNERAEQRRHEELMLELELQRAEQRRYNDCVLEGRCR